MANGFTVRNQLNSAFFALVSELSSFTDLNAGSAERFADRAGCGSFIPITNFSTWAVSCQNPDL